MVTIEKGGGTGTVYHLNIHNRSKVIKTYSLKMMPAYQGSVLEKSDAVSVRYTVVRKAVWKVIICFSFDWLVTVENRIHGYVVNGTSTLITAAGSSYSFYRLVTGRGRSPLPAIKIDRKRDGSLAGQFFSLRMRKKY